MAGKLLSSCSSGTLASWSPSRAALLYEGYILLEGSACQTFSLGQQSFGIFCQYFWPVVTCYAWSPLVLGDKGSSLLDPPQGTYKTASKSDCCAWDSPWSINLLFLPQGSLTSKDYALSKCYLPFEDRVLATYGAAAVFLVVLILAHLERLPSSFLFGWKLRKMHMRGWRACDCCIW